MALDTTHLTRGKETIQMKFMWAVVDQNRTKKSRSGKEPVERSQGSLRDEYQLCEFSMAFVMTSSPSEE